MQPELVKALRKQPMKPKLMIVDDEEDLRLTIRGGLEDHFEIIEAKNGKEAVDSAQKNMPDVILMDLMMPEMDGIAATENIRGMTATRHIPILLLTAANTKDYRNRAFNFGVDQFIAKPFDFEELTTRLLSVHKRSKQMNSQIPRVIQFLNLELNIESREIKLDGMRVELSPVEFDIVKLFILHRETLVTRSMIIDEVWKSKDTPERVMDAHIVSVRKKMIAFKGSLKTVYRSGYILRGN